MKRHRQKDRSDSEHGCYGFGHDSGRAQANGRKLPNPSDAGPPTPIRTGTHSPNMVPFLLYDSARPVANNQPYDERAVEESKLTIENTPDLMLMLLDEG